MTDRTGNEGYFERIAEEISAAFTHAPRPGINQLSSTRAFAADSEHGLIEDFLRQFSSWREIHRNDLRAYPGDETAILTFLSPAAFRYYLPAFLVSALECVFEDRQFVIAINLSLDLPSARMDGDRGLGRVRLQKFETLTDGEKRAVRMYLDAIHNLELNDELAAEAALKSYWQHATSD